MKNPNKKAIEKYNLEREYSLFIQDHMSEIEKICKGIKLPFTCCFQLSPDVFIYSKLCFENRTDTRIYTMGEVAKEGCLGWTHISTKTKKQYDNLVSKTFKLLKSIDKELKEHDSGSCDKDFALLRSEIETFIKINTPPPQE